MKTLIFAAAALSLSGVAVAQSTNAQPSGQTVNDPSQSTGPRGITQQGTDPNGMGSAPEGMIPARQMGGEYPACSRTVTDSCIQTYERGVRRPRR
jgi:hypothetical protein